MYTFLLASNHIASIVYSGRLSVSGVSADHKQLPTSLCTWTVNYGQAVFAYGSFIPYFLFLRSSFTFLQQNVYIYHVCIQPLVLNLWGESHRGTRSILNENYFCLRSYSDSLTH